MTPTPEMHQQQCDLHGPYTQPGYCTICMGKDQDILAILRAVIRIENDLDYLRKRLFGKER